MVYYTHKTGENMKQTLDKFIANNKTGMMLLDAPTGSGKTYSVIQILKEFIQGTNHRELSRIFYVTNLKTNLPVADLNKYLTAEEMDKCFVAKSYEEALVDGWQKIDTNTLPPEIKSSKEFKNLSEDLEILLKLMQERKKTKN